ncbi:MAG: hypothetical protein J6O56_00225 [Bacilli bacterium]|nr:hypothetical protein [Bacilli bacterium]
MNKFKVLVLLFLFICIPVSVKADNIVNMYLFYGDGCPHCAEEEKFIEKYLKTEKNAKLIKYEVWHSEKNREFLVEVQNKLNNHENGVPYLIIGDKVLVGYLEGTTDKKIEKYVEEYKNDKHYEDIISKIKNGENIEKKEEKKEIKKGVKPTKEKDEDINVPILGKVNPKKVSLPLLSVVLGFVDGFNPCAMWILIFLITMLLNTKDRKKMWILGLTFILTSGLVYLAFMLAWLNLATFINKIIYVRILIAAVAIIVGFFNINKYIQSRKKDDGCDVVNTSNRKKIMEKVMRITKEKSFILSLLGIMVLAASVNLIEMMCSIGLPLIFTQVLSLNNLSAGSYAFYMFLYILFFLIDDIVIFVIAMITLKVTGISTKYSKYAHLVAGIITIIIGLLMIIKPSLLMFNF